MAIEYKDILDSANRMLSSPSEVDQRNSISRAYYAAYHACHPVYDKLPMLAIEKTVKGGVHVKFISRFKHSVDIKVRQVGYILAALHQKRCVADYEIHMDVEQSDAQLIYLQSQKAIDLAEKL